MINDIVGWHAKKSPYYVIHSFILFSFVPVYLLSLSFLMCVCCMHADPGHDQRHGEDRGIRG